MKSCQIWDPNGFLYIIKIILVSSQTWPDYISMAKSSFHNQNTSNEKDQTTSIWKNVSDKKVSLLKYLVDFFGVWILLKNQLL